MADDEGSRLAAEWLREFPRLGVEPEEALIDHLLRDGGAKAREALAAVAKRRRRQKIHDRRRRNWEAVELILGTFLPERVSAIAAADRDFLWVLRSRLGRRRRDGETTIEPSPALLAAIFAAFAPLHLKASMPSGVQSGDANPWDATDFLVGCLNALAADPSAEASRALATLAGIDAGYAWNVGHSIADQHRARANAEWQPRPVEVLAKLVTDGPPIDHADLQRVLLTEFEIVQAKIRSSDADVWRFFYDQGNPKIEEKCSDALVTLLRQTDRPLTFTLEAHLGDNREGDIWCSTNELAVAVECKRHWHADLWTAFNWQLAGQQANDWRARNHGIYIVYWFGTDIRAVTGPPRGSGIKKPSSPEALEAALRERIASAGLPGIVLKVLDLSRPAIA